MCVCFRRSVRLAGSRARARLWRRVARGRARGARPGRRVEEAAHRARAARAERAAAALRAAGAARRRCAHRYPSRGRRGAQQTRQARLSPARPPLPRNRQLQPLETPRDGLAPTGCPALEVIKDRHTAAGLLRADVHPGLRATRMWRLPSGVLVRR
eukprot:6213165-Pleurochrysis_carterae.AAC.2